MRRKDFRERQAFLLHRWDATHVRGIEFHFTYNEWLAWWKSNLGDDWMELRGTHSDGYVMARHRDRGPYAPWNVKCITSAENCHEALRGKRNGNAKLTKEQATLIYQEVKMGVRGSVAAAARKYSISESAVRDIKTKITWKRVTDLLD